MKLSAALLDQSDFADIDRHFAKFIARFGAGDLPLVAASLLSRLIRAGHICLDLRNPPRTFENLPRDWPQQWPDLATWRSALQVSRAVGKPGDLTPLILDDAGRLYFRRYWDYERSLAAALLTRVRNGSAPPSSPARNSAGSDPQELAVETAQSRQLTVISGGPGTGKTTTVVRILARLLSEPGGESLRIALAAPTGKAAARLAETVRSSSKSNGGSNRSAQWLEHLPPAALARLPRSASTLHRLLGSREGSASFRHHARNPLAVDVLVIDEASMVALPLMAKTFDALPEKARVILLGDRDQLASVEPGAVLADIADAAGLSGSPLHDSLVMLTKNHRFKEDSSIRQASSAVAAGDVTKALEALRNTNARPADPAGDLGSSPVPAAGEPLERRLREPILKGYAVCLRERDPAEALRMFNRFRVLCALRRGPFGVEGLNRTIAGILREAGLIPESAMRAAGTLYPGMPVLIQRNDYGVGLFNGDLGIILPDPVETSGIESDVAPSPKVAGTNPAERATHKKPSPSAASGLTGNLPEPQLWAWFADEEGGMRRISPARLPEHEPAFAMTVHKSQGSEFERVLLILPDCDSAVLTRELLYTGLTRARSHVELWANEDTLRACIARTAERTSGLRDALAGTVRGSNLNITQSAQP